MELAKPQHWALGQKGHHDPVNRALALLWLLCARSHGVLVGTNPISQQGIAAAGTICNGVGVLYMGLERDGLGAGRRVPQKEQMGFLVQAGTAACFACGRGLLCASHCRLCATTPASGSALPQGFARS